jgi:hypothetical protein
LQCIGISSDGTGKGTSGSIAGIGISDSGSEAGISGSIGGMVKVSAIFGKCVNMGRLGTNKWYFCFDVEAIKQNKKYKTMKTK